MKQELLLSICIPTYNRPERVSKLLQGLYPQLNDAVELVILDDSPTSETECIVKNFFITNREQLQYFRGERIGYDSATLFLVQKARGKYVWWFGDDEMSVDAIDSLLFLLREKKDLDFVWINSKGRKDTCCARQLGKSRYFIDRNEVVSEIGDMLMYLSALVFRRAIALPGILKTERYVGTGIAGFYLILYILSKGKQFYYIAEPIIIANDKDPVDKLGYDSFEVFAIHILTIAMDKNFEGVFDKRSVKKMLSRNITNILKGMFVFRAQGIRHGLGSANNSILKLFPLYWGYKNFWLLLPFLLIPTKIDKYLYFVYKHIQSRDISRRLIGNQSDLKHPD